MLRRELGQYVEWVECVSLFWVYLIEMHAGHKINQNKPPLIVTI